jgi:hypothetical protein
MVGWLSMGRSGSALEVGRHFAPVRHRHLFDLGVRHCVAAAMAPMAGEAEWFTDHCGQPPGSVHVNFSLRRAALASRGAVPWRLAFVALGMRSRHRRWAVAGFLLISHSGGLEGWGSIG